MSSSKRANGLARQQLRKDSAAKTGVLHGGSNPSSVTGDRVALHIVEHEGKPQPALCLALASFAADLSLQDNILTCRAHFLAILLQGAASGLSVLWR